MFHRPAIARALFAALLAALLAGCGGGDPEDGGVNHPTVDPQELRNSAR
jgi:hypothetical protein